MIAPPYQLFPVPTHRYLLGISDLTGELMRFATNALGGGSGGAKGPKAVPSDPGAIVRAVLRLLRDIRESLEPFTFLVADMRKKQAVTTQSLRKIEDCELLELPRWEALETLTTSFCVARSTQYRTTSPFACPSLEVMRRRFVKWSEGR